jgi:hypothetical protein
MTSPAAAAASALDTITRAGVSRATDVLPDGVVKVKSIPASVRRMSPARTCA